ncbi:hypothetical protein [Oceanospirillum linum]|uniref:HEPN domain-containing protein n=1 Tax=Oceanospirillum linum TaxID=966 RepID=A0A1T1HEQ9_OCELI|nr:hypothetical protein [Oceanospirillum linum]OOV88339.1 hypothetical protein BTA35_0202140 [Oceanospirillum linum]SEF52791.1 hypothetical protein SAMN04489856_101439 [Oleiphilus messinensis]SMP04529.1 hypothetical protein SAMN06264348_101440 [Oceanospirillum linum]
MQLNPELKKFIDQIMPQIDEVFTEHNFPIHERFMKAAVFFVENCIKGSSLGDSENILEHDAFSRDIVPLFMQWYYETYGELAKPPHQSDTYGIVTSYAQPIKIKIPLTTSSLTEKGTCWLKFPDSIEETESYTDFIDDKVRLEALVSERLRVLENEVLEVASKTRKIHLNLMSVSGLEPETLSMKNGIWAHFEKAIDDIISFNTDRVSIGCWELHLAVEKSFKVLIKQKIGKKIFGHNLLSLYEESKQFCADLDVESLKSLPSEKDAIKLRYAEQFMHLDKAIEHYKTALNIVCTLTENLDRKLRFNNAALEIKQAPWAI